MKNLLLAVASLLFIACPSAEQFVRVDLNSRGYARAVATLNSGVYVFDGQGSVFATTGTVPFIPVTLPKTWNGAGVRVYRYDPEYDESFARGEPLSAEAEGIVRKLLLPGDIELLGITFESTPTTAP